MKLNKITSTLPRDFMKFLMRLDQNKLTSQHKRLTQLRNRVLTDARDGRKPTPKLTCDIPEWKREVPSWMEDQRNQMTGPANDAKLVLRMMNSGSPGVMLDLEDSCANTPEAILGGHEIIKKALRRELSWGNETLNDQELNTVVWVRVRGLHMGQEIKGTTRRNQYVSASLFDLAMHFYDMELDELCHDPCIYIPKSENAQEARWWRSALGAVEKAKGWKRGTIKAMALVESYPLAFELERFIYELQPYLVGLNLGRWDYMASFIDYNYDDFVFPDRNSVPIDIPFFQNLRKKLVNVCHEHGLLAIGGMTALFPSRKDDELNQRALKALEADKKNEAICGFDGAWTGHPDQNEVAVAQFPEPNQLKVVHTLSNELDLSSVEVVSSLPVTENGTREAVRTCLEYRVGVLQGKGAKLINGYMEDLATDRIYRIMLAQRLDAGLFTEEQLRSMIEDEDSLLLTKAGDILFQLIKDRRFNPQ